MLLVYIFKRQSPILLATYTQKQGKLTLFSDKIYIYDHEKMHHALYRGMFGARTSLKPLFYPFCCTENVSQTAMYTPRDEEQNRRTEKNDHTVSYQNYSTNTGSCTQ